LLEVVIDTDGAIESAKLVKPLSPLYDRELLAAAKRWKYRPAMKGSEPVKYRWLMEIVLKSR
jgi:TonB family protein